MPANLAIENLLAAEKDNDFHIVATLTNEETEVITLWSNCFVVHTT